MKKLILFVLAITAMLPAAAQETSTNKNPRNVTRQGFGTHSSYDLGLGFVNPNFITDGSAYYFKNWDTNGVIYTKSNGNFKIEKVNLNLYTSTLDALYDDTSVFSFDSKNLMKIVINEHVFRVFEIGDELKILESIYNDGLSVYKFNSVSFSEGSINPMVNRKVNKYIRKDQYYLYRDRQLIKMKMSSKAFSKLIESEEVSGQSILEYIEKAKLSLKNENDLLKVLTFASRHHG